MEETLSLFVTTERRKKLMVRRNNTAVNGGGGRSGDGDHPFFVEGSQVEVSSDDEGFRGAWYVATIVGIDKNAPPPSSSPSSKRKRGTKKYLVEYETLLAGDEDDEMSKKPLREYVDVSFMRPLPPPPRPPPSPSSGGDGGQEPYELNDVVDAFHRDGWWTGVVRRVIDDGSKFVVFFQNPPEEFEFGRSELRVHHDWVDCKWVRAEKKTECIVEKASMSIKGPRKKLRGSGTEKSHRPPIEYPVKYRRSKKKHLKDPESPNDKEIIEPKGKGGVSYENRTRGRSQKVLVESPGEEKNGPEVASHEIGLKDSEEIEDVQWTVASEEKNGAEAAASYAIAVKDCAANVVAQSTVAEVYLRGIVGINQGYPSQFPQRNSNIMSNIMDLHLAKIDNQLSEAIAEKSGRRRKSCASKIRKPRSITSNKSPTQDACREKQSEESEARPQLTWREGINSPSTVDESRMSFDLNVIQSAEDGDRQDESAMQSPGIASVNNDVSPKTKKSPFEKHSPIWGTLERMEIFQKMPQQPHFSPLVKSKEESREGLAIGNMVIFASVVEKTSKLQLSDPRCIIDSSLETLADLENHGFDVEPIRGRLKELLSMKERQGHLLEESKEVERKIAEQSHERGKIGEEIGLIKKKMKELQEKLALATSMMEMKDHEIAAMKSKRDVMDQEIQNTPHDFLRIAAAPW